MSSSIQEALQKAKYNETVHVTVKAPAETTVETEESSQTNQPELSSVRQICLIPCLNEVQGGIQYSDLLQWSCEATAESPRDTADADDSADVMINGGTNSSLNTTKNAVAVRELRTNRWFFPMLNDHRRNELYERAVELAIDHVVASRSRLLQRKTYSSDTSVEQTKDTLRVFEIGTGTGLLSMMATRYFEKLSQQKVPSGVLQNTNIRTTSMEMSDQIAGLARRTISDNKLDHAISVHQSHSSTAQAPASYSYDLCLSELVEDGLLGEGWLPTLRDAWARHVLDARHGHPLVVLPRAARVYMQLVTTPESTQQNRSSRQRNSSGDRNSQNSGNWLQKYAGPHLYQHKGINSDSNQCTDSSIEISFAVDEARNQPLVEPSHVVLPVHADKLLRDGRLVALPHDPVLLFEFDVSSPERIPSTDGRSCQRNIVLNSFAPNTMRSRVLDESEEKPASLESMHTLPVHGALVWWELDLFGDAKYSTKPGHEPWQDHWHPCLHFFDAGRNQTIEVEIDGTVTIEASHDDARIFVNICGSTKNCEIADSDGVQSTHSKKRPRTAIPGSSLVSCERAYQLNDTARLDVFYKAIQYALLHSESVPDGDPSNKTFLDVSDFGVGACMAYKLGAGRVVSVEGSSSGLAHTAARMAQLSNCISASSDSATEQNFEILQCHNESLSLGLLGGRPADICFAEPYYEILEGWHLQEAMNFYFTIQYLRRQGLLSKSASILPSSCRIMGCIIESTQLRSAYCGCGDDGQDAGSRKASIRGFDHSHVNRAGNRFHEYDISLPMWQYDFKVLSAPVELGILSYLDDSLSFGVGEDSAVEGQFLTEGTCDALMVWLEYSYGSSTVQDSNCSSDTLISSTNNQAHRQIIRMLNRAPSKHLYCVNGSNIKDAVFRCTSRFGGIDGPEDHVFDVKIDVSSSNE